MTNTKLINRRSRGFTLVELIIVIAVIGVLAAILIPVFSNVIRKANAKSALSDARNAVSQYVTEALEQRTRGDNSAPENICIIVEKGGRYYAFGYNTSVSSSILVSNANENGMDATDLDNLIHNHSFNVQNGGTYDPNTTYTLSDGAFYLVPYTGTTSNNPNVRGFVQSNEVSDNFLRLDEENDGYGFDLNVGDTTIVFHGCLVNGTYGETSTASNDSTGSGDTPPATTSYSVNFTTTGIESADLANVVYKKGGAALTNPATLTEGTGVGTLTAECPVATSAYSYTFTGATASNGHSTIDEADMTITFAFTKVMAQTYNVTYNANGGSGTMTDNTDYLTNAVITLPENTFTAPEHKHFTGWLINNTGELRAAGYQFNITADTEVYAQWGDDAQIAVHFNSNGGTGTMADVSVYAGSYTLPECTFTKTHYHFNGWKANNTGATLGATYNVTEEVTFYATWEQDATYTITYDGNGATGGTAPTDSNSYYMNDTANLLGKGSLAYTHKHFTGWKVENGGALLSAGSSYTVTGNVTMYAQWEDDELFSVEYIQVAGVISVPAKQYYPVGTATVPIDHDGVVIDDMYVREGWQVGNYHQTGLAEYTESLNTSAITAGTNITLTVGLAKKRLQVTFASSPAGAAGLPGTTYYNYADGLTYTISATPTLSGYDFTGYTHTSSTGVTVTLSGDMGRTLTIAKSGSTWAAGTATVTANFTATATPTPSASPTSGGGGSTTLTLVYKNSMSPYTEITRKEMPITCSVGSSITFNVTQLKQGGYYYMTSDQNHISVEKDTTLSPFFGTVQGTGATKYEFTYTRPAGSCELVIYISSCMASMVSDATAYGDPNIPDVPNPSANIVTTRTIPGVTNPMPISSETELAMIGAYPQFMMMNWILANNITLTGNWTPLGHGMGQNGSDLPFTGTFDGNGKTISGLSANWPTSGNTEYPYIGLFAIIGQGATIADLTITNATVNGAYYVGVIAGQNYGTIINCYVNGELINDFGNTEQTM